jgi:replicative DNA helicase
MSKCKFIRASDALVKWREDLKSGKPPTFFPIADQGPLSRIEIGPKLITLIGGAPGAGKTAFVMQSVVDALRLTEDLQAVVCNVEMTAEVLLERQLARLSGVPLASIRYRRVEEMPHERIELGLATIEAIADRLSFVKPPFDLGNIAATAETILEQSGSERLLLVLDYLQRIESPGKHADRRGSVDFAMTSLRGFAEQGAAVLVVSSVGRQKDNRGRSSYDAEFFSLASYKESGELEFGADDAFILAPSKDLAGGRVLKHLKARHSETKDLELNFDGATQQFTALTDAVDRGEMQQELQAAWSQNLPKGAKEWTA